jgi:two-component system, NtrC family, C4-dicarboxylate transport sensor histidine kinase DctB
VARAVLYTDASGVRTNAIRNAAAAGGAVLVAALVCLYLLQVRRSARQRQRARELLQQAHDDLGRRVEERTAELRQINQELMREIAERERAEAVLRTAQEELVQAGKMAMIGQMAAGVAHEINQPLMALRALSDNIRILLQRGRTEDAAARLEGVADLTDRMGRITAQLKTFARKSSGGGTPQAQLQRCVANAVELLRNRIRAQQVQVDMQVPPLAVHCDATRLEQVLVNLVGNALDAMGTQEGARRVYVGANVEGSRAVVRVADNGPGIAPEAAAHLFEPFFSTKPQGEGLGLGLVISESIVREWGGSLRLVPASAGATFEFDLPLEAQPEERS